MKYFLGTQQQHAQFRTACINNNNRNDQQQQQLQVGTSMQGRVVNYTTFGAFVDIGVGPGWVGAL